MGAYYRSEKFFAAGLRFRWLIVLVSFAAIAVSVSFLPNLTKDTTADAFIDPSSPALIYRDKVEETFGLRDPVVLAVIDRREGGVFRPETLALVEQLTDEVSALQYVDPERVTSLATENNIAGVIDGVVVDQFFDEDAEYFETPKGSAARAAEIKAAIDAFPLYQGSLVARDGSATLIVAELINDDEAQAAYDAMLAIVDSADTPAGVELHVAGEGAVSGYLSTYIDQDAKRLNPMAAVIITIVLAFAFMSLRGAILPNIIVLGSVLGAFGLMAASGTSFFVITNGLVVNLIGIAVADSIHIISEYYDVMRANPKADKRSAVARAMAQMWRPVTLTTITTIAGFLALAASSEMPPVSAFGLFGAAGVFIAWVYSMTLLPALLSVWPTRRIPWPFRIRKNGDGAENMAGRLMSLAGRAVLAKPQAVLAIAAGAVLVGVIGASQLVVEEARIENFKSTEPIYMADKAMNEAMDGVYYLDVLVETQTPGGLYEPENLRRIEALQEFMTTLDHVNGAVSIVDYVKQLNKSVNEGREEAYIIPDDKDLIAQLFFLYSASGDPTDFEEEVDYEYRQALVRSFVDTDRYTNNKVIVPALEKYLSEQFNNGEMTGTVTGRINVNYHWLRSIEENTAMAVLLSFAAVLLAAMFVFRSVVGGLLATAPVAVAVLFVYAVMGFAGIPLGVGTSMFSAIAIGLSIDFAIHTLDRLRDIARKDGVSDEALLRLYPTTGRALFFNFIAVGGGFGVLMTSDVPPLVKFGALVAIAVSVAFLASMTLLPALVKVLRPKFLFSSESKEAFHAQTASEPA